MASVNKVIIVGNLGADPTVRYSPDGAAICNISVATTSTWKNKSTGERQESTEWHRIVFYNRLAEIAGEYLRKGRSVYVEGRLKTRKWTDKEGIERYTTEIIGDQMQMVGGRDDSAEQSAGNAPQEQSRSTQAPQGRNAYAEASGAGQRQSNTAMNLADMDDDIPF